MRNRPILIVTIATVVAWSVARLATPGPPSRDSSSVAQAASASRQGYGSVSRQIAEPGSPLDDPGTSGVSSDGGVGPKPQFTPEEKAQHWLELLRSFEIPEMTAIRVILGRQSVDLGTLDLVAPRIYHDLVRLSLFEEFEKNALDQLAASMQPATFEPSPEVLESFQRLQRNVAATFNRYGSNLARQLRYRITDEAGIADPASIDELLRIRPPGPLRAPPDFDPSERGP